MYRKLIGSTIIALSLSLPFSMNANAKTFSVSVSTQGTLANTTGYRIFMEGVPAAKVTVSGWHKNIQIRGTTYPLDNFLRGMVGGTNGKGYSPYLMQTTPVTFLYSFPDDSTGYYGYGGTNIESWKYLPDINNNEGPLATLSIYNTDWSLVKRQPCFLANTFEAGNNVLIKYSFNGTTKATSCQIN